MRSFQPHAGGVSLSQVFPNSRVLGGSPNRISSCCDDSRRCRPGDLFAAIVGSRVDGHDYAAEAVRRGASVILAERPVSVGVPTCLVDDSRIAFARLCHALSGDPTQGLRTMGITGTHGKTSVAILVTSILESFRARVGVMTSLGYCDSVQARSPVDDAPSSVEIARWMASTRDEGCSHAVVELSSATLAAHRAEGLALDVAVLTNLRRAHLGQHGSVLNYRKIKQRIFGLVKPDGIAVCNADDPATKFLLGELRAPLLTFGMKSPADVTASELEIQHGEQTFLLEAADDCIPVRTKTIGVAHIQNCLAAATACLAMGVDLPTIVEGLETAPLNPGCLERIDRGNDFATYLDAAPTSDALASSLRTLRKVTRGRLLCVLSPSPGHDPADRPLLGRVLERMTDRGIITDFSSREGAKSWAHDVLDGYDRPALAHLIPSRLKAMTWALREAQAGDTVLIAGTGADALAAVEGAEVAPTTRQLRADLSRLEP